jgi:hypothetical protein
MVVAMAARRLRDSAGRRVPAVYRHTAFDRLIAFREPSGEACPCPVPCGADDSQAGSAVSWAVVDDTSTFSRLTSVFGENRTLVSWPVGAQRHTEFAERFLHVRYGTVGASATLAREVWA